VLSPPRALPSSAAAEDEEPGSQLAENLARAAPSAGRAAVAAPGAAHPAARRLAQQPGRHCRASALDGKPGEMLVEIVLNEVSGE